MNPSNNIQTYYSRAKLMIAGEYLVLRGALALAIPLKKGQSLKVTEHQGSPSLVWKTFVNGQHWFDATFSINEFVIGNTNDFPTAQNLREILLAAKSLQPEFLNNEIRYEAYSELDFDIKWGLGSSSSLIANIARWAGIDAFDLFRLVSSGSGYDLATSMSEKPVLFRLHENGHSTETVDFYPPFRNHLYFAYLGKKRNSSQAVDRFKMNSENDVSQKILDLDAITKAMLAAKDLNQFRKLMRDHEKIISGLLGVPPLSFKLLSDFSGDIKSLGAWGGDFVLLASEMPRDYVISWLRRKEMNTWFGYEEIALSPNNVM